MFKNRMLAILSATAFDPGWKKDADGKLELDKSGNPIYIDSSNKEMIVDQSTITRLNGEARAHREAKEAAEAKLKTFEGIDDPAAAKAAIALAAKIDQKTLIDAGKVDELKAQITAQYTQQLSEKDKALQATSQKLDSLMIDNIFAGSKFIQERVITPPDMFKDSFGKNFKIEEGKVVAYDRAGNRLMSKTRFGEPADPNEAIELLVDMHPQKDMILRANSGSGSGSGGDGGNRGGSRTMKRSDFMALPPNQQAETAAKAGKGELQIVD